MTAETNNKKGNLNNHFYHKTTKLYSSVFLSLFSDITVLRANGIKIKVPIGFTNVQKFNVANEQNKNLYDEKIPRTAIQLPRIAAKFVGWRRDTSRVRNKRYQLESSSSATHPSSQYERVPFQLTYTLKVSTEYLDDMFQIMEQILVVFNPTVEVIIKDNPDLDSDTSVVITLENNDFSDVVEGRISDTRTIETEFVFTLDGYLYMPTENMYGIINKVIVSYTDMDTKEFLGETIVTPTTVQLE